MDTGTYGYPKQGVKKIDPSYDVPEGVDIRGRYDEEFAKILTKDALKFVAELQREFRSHIRYALECRKEAKRRYNEGALPGFDPATRYIREGEWVCAPVPPAVADRKVEITGPVERKMVINALNSGAKVFMADFEDALSPSWENLMRGQVNLKDAVAGTITFNDKARNKVYKLNDQTAKLFVRPRGWHLPEAHIFIDGEPATGCLVDFGLYFYHNHAPFRQTQGAGFGPFFYLPKMEHSREAKIWNNVFERAEKMAAIERGSIRATVLIETLPAVFQMNEILYELRDHSVGLNCGRWDYIFSYVKTFQSHPDRLLPDRVLVGMTQHFMKSYSDLLIRTCHRRGVHAMGGMAAQIPIRDDPAANEAALELVRKDKLREVKAGHDGTWAAHPGLIPACVEVFNNNMGNAPNQIKDAKRDDAASITEEDLLQIPRGVRTMDGLRLNTRVGIQYVAAWLTGSGSVPLYNLMEDAATAEISRVQNWQWIKYGVELDGDGLGVRVSKELFSRVVEEEMARIESEVGKDKFKKGMYKEACKIFKRQCTAPTLDDFLTLNAYNYIVIQHPKDVSLTDTSDAHKAMNIVLPFLLTEGILSKVDSVRKASIGVVMKLTKHAGTAIRPHMADLVCCMLESLSSLEDQGLNYVELHAANVGIQSDKLENLRISIAKGSLMWETLDLCIRVIDAESLDTLIPRLAHLVRSGVGLNTRVGVANFITLLLESVGVDIKPYANMLVRLLFPVVKEEKSITAKRAFASACAKVLKYVPVSQAQKLIEDTVALHAGDKNSQIACAYLLKSYSSVAADVVGGYHAVIIPVVFLSRFEDDKSISNIFEELWEEYTSGERVTLNLYLGEIVSLICEGMSSSSWASKRKSAQAICRLSEVLGDSLSSHHEVLLQSLMKEIPGRLWEGKEVLLLALGALSTSCHKAISAEGSAPSIAILSVVSSACSKKAKKYREAAFSALEQVIKAFGNPDFFNMVFPLLFDMTKSAPAKSGQQPLAGDTAKTDSDGVEEIFVPHTKLVECLTSCIHVANINDILENQENLMLLYAAFLSPEHKWTVKTTAFLSIKELCSRLHNVIQDSSGSHDITRVASLVQEIFHSTSPKILHCISTVKIAQVHVSASECLLEVLKLSMEVPTVSAIDEGFKDELLHQYEIEKNEEAKSLLRKCLNILQDWKH